MLYEKIPILSMIESEIYILNYDKTILDSYLFHINQIVERTESQVLINILFDEITDKFSIYEEVFTNIYLGLLQMGSKFLNEKSVIVLFPQLGEAKFNNSNNIFYISNNENLKDYENFIKIEQTIIINRDYSYNLSGSKNNERILYQFENVCVGGSFDHFHIGHYVINTNLRYYYLHL
jgi:hypothetical protein